MLLFFDDLPKSVTTRKSDEEDFELMLDRIAKKLPTTPPPQRTTGKQGVKVQNQEEAQSACTC